MAVNNDTYIGSLDVLLRQIALMKTLADANLPFVVQLETAILEERRNPERMMQAAGILPPSGQNPQGMGAPGMPGAPAPGGPGGAGAPPPSFAGAGAPPGTNMSSPAIDPMMLEAMMASGGGGGAPVPPGAPPPMPPM